MPSLRRSAPASRVIEPARRLRGSLPPITDRTSRSSRGSRRSSSSRFVPSRCSKTWETMRALPARGRRSAGSRICVVGTRKPSRRPRRCSTTRVSQDVRGRRSFSSNTHSPTAPAPPTKAWNYSTRRFREPRIRSALHRSLLLAMLGRFEEAWQTARESSARAQALTGNNQAQFLGQIATLEGDHAAAVECWRDHCDLLERHGDRAASLLRPHCSDARCARSAGTTRQSRSRNSGGSSPTRATS